ncbi:Uu.00g010980.m01.CDS01 [Anthostomella pinea]|uniref:Uu.00g010980.m01.CDS01 n=1 Tax=Anthostomella pinea TaxID=933095 RepID=A0AAI8YPZ7_9PEZI|nr:Uu.00g010980.m01.CDS01 [Anthostomella pinea]
MDSADYRGLLEDDGEDGSHVEKIRLQPGQFSYDNKRGRRIYLGVLLVSLAFNLLFAASYLRASFLLSEKSSPYAKLERNREEPYVIVTPYSSENEALQDQLWYDINVDAAVVALSDDWASQHDLRKAQRFPWDQTKGLYILHGYHNLHCLKLVYISMSEYRRGVPQTRSWHHVSHCLDALRRQIICDADDTPRATDRRAEVVSGLLQHRRCRSWDQLEEFATQNTACYKRPDNPDAEGTSKLSRFKHCPPGSGYVVTDDYISTDELLVGLPEESLQDHL